MIVGTFSMAKPNSTWRVNRKDMPQCCYEGLLIEMYRRGNEGEERMREGDTFTCPACKGEMICDPSLRDSRLRWRWNGNR